MIKRVSPNSKKGVREVLNKKFLVTAFVIAAAAAIAISTIAFGNRMQAESKRAEAAVRLDETSGEVAATLPLFHRVDENYFRGSQPLVWPRTL